jgi:cytochrome c oxidase subunit 2
MTLKEIYRTPINQRIYLMGNKMKQRTTLAGLMLGLVGLLHGGSAFAVNDMPGGPARFQLNLHPAATKVAEEVATLHWMMLIICSLIFIAVFGVMFYSIYKHRRSLGHQAASFHESTTVEIIWTVVPLLIVIGMALPATKTVVAMKDTTNSDVTIKVTGYQWKWGYDYIKGEGEGISFLQTLSTPREQINNQAEKSDNC